MYVIMIKLASVISEVFVTERHQKKAGGRMRQMGRGDLGLEGVLGRMAAHFHMVIITTSELFQELF